MATVNNSIPIHKHSVFKSHITICKTYKKNILFYLDILIIVEKINTYKFNSTLNGSTCIEWFRYDESCSYNRNMF